MTLLRADDNNVLQKVIVTASRDNPRALIMEFEPTRVNTTE